MGDPEPPSPGQTLMRHALRLGSMLLGGASLLDLGRESASGGAWRATGGLGNVYGLVVGGYALSREWEKRDGTAPDVPRIGHLFCYAWVVYPCIIWLFQITNWLPATWPEPLNQTLGWVFGVYTATKFSKGNRVLARARAAVKAGQKPPRPEYETPEQYWARHALRFGSQLLGAVCWVDAAVEAFSVGEWHFTGSIYVTYSVVLSAYAATREWEKWTDRYDQDASWGHWFLWAWIALAAAVWAAGYLGFWVVWPSHLTSATATVIAVFLGSKGSALLRKDAGPNWWGIPAPAGERPPAGEQTPANGGKGQAKRQPDPGEDPAVVVAEACRARGTFTTADIVADTGYDAAEVRGHIGWLVRDHKVEKLSRDLYRWIGN